MSLRATIMDQMAHVAREHGKTLAPLRDDLALIDTGLDSLGIAVLVARLEDRLGSDPFTNSESMQFPETFGEFVKVYDDAGRH